ncbi:hypothetical protein PMAYCL1PPCAC_13840 [Pristionchus mayeri]|uniref:Uncharacterized protein n=1 Tax=Pristionchus mayeri TaxID=1317129 RepID=A0AAN4ZTQ6_9BILA|nr:hypothetical protein PMAYCL1PPCAC_13840 [Pristionchus mayeri]
MLQKVNEGKLVESIPIWSLTILSNLKKSIRVSRKRYMKAMAQMMNRTHFHPFSFSYFASFATSFFSFSVIESVSERASDSASRESLLFLIAAGFTISRLVKVRN